MKATKYYDAETLYFSKLYGSGIYKWSGQLVPDPLCVDNGEGLTSPLLINVISGEQYYARRFSYGARGQFHFWKTVLTPAQKKCILWPSDIIEIGGRQENLFKLFVSQEYAPVATPIEKREGDFALLFPYGGYPNVENGIRKIAKIDELNWKNSDVRRMAVGIARAIENVNRDGYFYTDIHLSRLFFSDDWETYLDFSNLMFSVCDSLGENAEEICGVSDGDYPIEFGDPSVVRGIIPHLDYHSQNYSLCALLFYLFFGVYPYDGRLLTGYADDAPQSHYIKFRDYHKMPVFIFDPDDVSNRLGAMAEEREIIYLWEELPDVLQDLFLRTLKQSNAERTDEVNNPTPSMWLKCFAELGWCDDTEDGGQDA